ncbi:nuclear transport factor 2 family protein [Streptomyces cinereospinus]|uniref:Nuclear transport factor 2 family protein n=1 Tax=Streptomyces cinereospinus TaxID=285561 RepID=A0ABV5NBJ2_9ACTN
MDEVSSISQLVLRERQGRGLGLWDQLRDCYHPDSHVTTSWFDGTGPEFVEVSEAGHLPGRRVVNRLSPPVVQQTDDRAVVELPSTTTHWFVMGEVEALLTSYMRLIYRVERRDEVWRIVSLGAINQADTLDPAVPGVSLDIDQELLGTFRWSYRHLCYRAALQKMTVPDDLPGDDRPEEAAAFLRSIFAWLER